MRELRSRQWAVGSGQGQNPARLSRFTAHRPLPTAHSHRAFTLTELLIVIAIIALLAALATAAAVNALRAANRGKITMAIQGVSRAVEDFKTDFGAYPPNAMNPMGANPGPGTYGALAVQDLRRMFDKAFPRHNEPPALITALAGANSSAPNLEQGMTAAESLYFWLGGFSADEQYPISGPGGPSFLVSVGEIIEDRNQRYEFDLEQLGPRKSDGTFDDSKQRIIVYPSPVPGENGVDRQINFWQYRPKNSVQPLVYFDVSRHKPGTSALVPGSYDAWAAKVPDSGLPLIYAFKQKRSGAATIGSFNDVTFVNQGKFQIFHPGLDDLWGDYFEKMGSGKVGGPNELILFPDGPFIGEISDTLTNFSDGALADAADE